MPVARDSRLRPWSVLMLAAFAALAAVAGMIGFHGWPSSSAAAAARSDADHQVHPPQRVVLGGDARHRPPHRR